MSRMAWKRWRDVQLLEDGIFSLSKVQSRPWSKPLGIALKVTGEVCSIAADAGVPVIGDVDFSFPVYSLI